MSPEAAKRAARQILLCYDAEPTDAEVSLAASLIVKADELDQRVRQKAPEPTPCQACGNVAAEWVCHLCKHVKHPLRVVR